MALRREQLLDAEFLEAIAHLRLIARRVARGGRFAEHRSRDAGAGLEFKDFRPYVPGDDLRAVDWNIYRRLGRIFLREFEEFEDLPVYLLPDVSRSGFYETPPRALAGLRCALGLAAVALDEHDRVGILPFSDDLVVHMRPRSGRDRLLSFADGLARIEPGGRTDFARALRRLSGMRLREGLCVLISDFFDPAGIEAVTDALAGVRHRLLLVRLVRRTDREPDATGDLRLVDCESGLAEDVSVTPAVIARYREAYDRFRAGLADFARRRPCGLLELDVERPLVPQLADLFESGRLLV